MPWSAPVEKEELGQQLHLGPFELDDEEFNRAIHKLQHNKVAKRALKPCISSLHMRLVAEALQRSVTVEEVDINVKAIEDEPAAAALACALST